MSSSISTFFLTDIIHIGLELRKSKENIKKKKKMRTKICQNCGNWQVRRSCSSSRSTPKNVTTPKSDADRLDYIKQIRYFLVLSSYNFSLVLFIPPPPPRNRFPRIFGPSSLLRLFVYTERVCVCV